MRQWKGCNLPQHRCIGCAVAHAKQGFREALRDYVGADDLKGYDESVAESFPASDSPTGSGGNGNSAPHEYGEDVPADIGRPSKKVAVTLADGSSFELDHGAVTIAANVSWSSASTSRRRLSAGRAGIQMPAAAKHSPGAIWK